MGRVQGSVVQGRVYLLPLQILYRFLNSLCNITGAFLKSVLSHKGAVSNFIEIQPVRTAIKLPETKKIIAQDVKRRYEYQRKYTYLQRNLMIRGPTFSGLTFRGLTSRGFICRVLHSGVLHQGILHPEVWHKRVLHPRVLHSRVLHPGVLHSGSYV